MINLTKHEERKETVKVTLKKYSIPNQKAAVKFFIDCSGSMGMMYKNGEVQEIFERVLPLADILDDDKTMQVYKFNGLCNYVGEATVNNADGFINFTANGGTNYTPIIKEALKTVNGNMPTLAIVITDGECADARETQKTIIEASKKNIFFQFIGIGHEKFRFLEKLDTIEGRYIDNVGFFKVDALKNLSDHELYNLLIQEFPSWLFNYTPPTESSTPQPSQSTRKGLFGLFK